MSPDLITDKKTTVIECFEDNLRLDVFLTANMHGFTRSAVQKLIGDGQVSYVTKNNSGQGIFVTQKDQNQTPGSALINKNFRTSAGHIYTIIHKEPESAVAEPQEIPLDVVFEDNDIIVINKPKGMVVHPAAGHKDNTLVNALLYHCKGSLSGIGGITRPGIVHRIDKETSGLIIAAKNDHSHIYLSSLLHKHAIKREYSTIVCGRVKDNAGTIDLPIGRSPTDRMRQAVTDKNSRTAITHYEVIARYIDPYYNIFPYTYLRCRLKTGRTHQIRVHLSYIGYPVLGDVVYGHKKPRLGMSSQCLHADLLSFIHPTTYKEITLSIPLPEYFTNVLAKLDLE